MAHVVLILPHLPQRMGSPYLGQQYIAASLIEAGHEVTCLDMAAIREPASEEEVLAVVATLEPAMIGMTLFTYNARRAYELVDKLSKYSGLLVAGGPHATIRPEEPLEFGFDLCVMGEGELAVVEVMQALETGGDLSQIPGVMTRQGETLHRGPARPALDDLDQLAFPLVSYPCYRPESYHDAGLVIPGGLMTSRGCPARCTFCANYVTGRRYRWRSAQDVVQEMILLREHYGVTHFPFWDDAFTARRPRLLALCDAIEAEPGLRGITWTCITPGNMVRPEDLRRMAQVGCVAINFGLESGDKVILKAIGKGVQPGRVEASVLAAKEVGMTTIVNFMFGFPSESVEQLGNTLAFMKKLAPVTDFFNNRGVLVPFPGTAIFDKYRETYELDRWWLRPEMVPDEPNIHILDPTQSQAYLETDPSLALDFFRYSDDMREAIAACVRFKAQHNAATVAAMQAGRPSPGGMLDKGSPSELQQRAAASVG